MLSLFTRFQVRAQNPERGATAIEYGLMVSLIAVVIVAAVTAFGGSVSGLINKDAVSI